MSRGAKQKQAQCTTLAQAVRANEIHEKRGPLCKWNHMALVLLKLAYFTLHVKFQFYEVSDIVKLTEAENGGVVVRV